MTPDCAARPTWKDLVMVPKLATRPEDIEAAIAMAVAAPSASRPRNLAQAAAAATVPSTARRMPALAMQRRRLARQQFGPDFEAGNIGRQHFGAA